MPIDQVSNLSSQNHSVHQLFETASLIHSEIPAVLFGKQSITYNELNTRANKLVKSILFQAFDQEIIGISTTRSIEMIVSLLAILKSGKAYLPLDPAYPKQRLKQIIADSGIKTCLAPADEEVFFKTFELNNLHYNDLQDAPEEPVVRQNPNIYVLYTSGSTGTPKGVYMTQSAMVNLVLWQHENSLSGPGSRTLQFSPLSFDVSFQEIFTTLTIGATLVLIDDDLRLDPVNLLEYIDKNKVDRIFMPFVALQFLAEAATSANQFPKHLKEIITAGEQLKITTQVKDFFKGLNECILYNQYGPTECHVVTQLKLNGEPDKWPTLPGIGSPISNTAVYILDEKKVPLPNGETGELAISGLSLAEGYLNKSELTAEKFSSILLNGTQTRVYLTGDLARYQEDGTLEFLGRRDDQVKIRGYRIELGEIELVLNHIEGIKQAIVIAKENLAGQKQLLAYLVSAGEHINSAALRKRMEEKLPDYMIPSSFIWMDNLPKTSSGKVDKKALPLPERKRPEISVLFTPAKTKREKEIARIWASVLEVDAIGIHDNFFELGGNSLLALKTVSLLRSTHQIELPITKLYQFPSIIQIINYLDNTSVQRIKTEHHFPADTDQPIAIIGMAVRFPGANTVEELWEVLKTGKETTRFFKNEELDATIFPDLKSDPNYVKARGIIEDADLFDPSFFGINPKLAEAMDPQQRIFLEISRDVLEKSGHLPEIYNGLIGVFAGSGNNSYYANNIAGNRDLINEIGAFQVMTVNEKDYISSRTSYHLNLKGPAVSVYSACSTSLLAVAQAVESLRKNQCDVAVAGGVSITSPVYSGHIYQEGAMLSKDGHCRPFDDDATGTVFSDGAGVVLLKTLSAAKRDRDIIYGLIKGIGINNDGSSKGSFSAPSTDGQAAAITMALSDANTDPATISYVETHGTATPLGDPIEIEGLKQAFGDQPHKQYCAIGSIKSNMGHMTAAAGVAGLIKTTLALYHEEIPPSINFEKPNQNISFSDSPFYVNQRLRPWDTAGIRRAGISSFGVGGTNVHVIVEEHDHVPAKNTDQGSTKNIFTWSAKSTHSLQSYNSVLKNYLQRQDNPNLADIAYTLQTTRISYAQRSFIVAGTKEELENSLDQFSGSTAQLKHMPGETVFLFPGQGAQYVNMGAELYRDEPVFKASVDKCAAFFSEYLDKDIREIIYADKDDPQSAIILNQTKYTQPALFVISYALAQLWMSWGIQPSILCGHSIGEYVAAHLAGIFSLEDAIKLIASRGLLVSNLPTGSMLSVRSPATVIKDILPDNLSIAAVNSPRLCVVAGNDEAVNAFQQTLDEKQILHKRLSTSHAFHSSMMDPILITFGKVMEQVKLNRPQKPIVSTVTGLFLTDAEAQNPTYWTEHLRKTVQFSSALDTILAMDNPILIETGPGNSCTTLAWQHKSSTSFNAIASLDGKDVSGSCEAILKALGKVWLSGLNPDWSAVYNHQQRRRVDLPGYSYHKKRYWAEPKRTLSIEQHTYPTKNQPPIEAAEVMRKDTLIEKIKHILVNTSGIEMDDVTPEMNFIEIGLDSLLLTQVAIVLKKEFSLPVTFRQLNEEYSTIGTLATFIDQNLPIETTTVNQPVPTSKTIHHVSVPDDSPVGLIAQQLQLLSKQLELLTGNNHLSSVSGTELSSEELIEIKKPFGAIARIERKASALQPSQKEFLQELIQRYNKKTLKSKQYAIDSRPYMADPRVVSGFKPLTKELIYPIVINRSSGSKLWDLDNNEYIDTLNGFGSNLLGYQPDVIKKAMHDQIEKGYEVGPQHELAAEVSKLICEFTGFDRAALCSTGSEAVLGCIRVARTVTGRSLIVAFAGSYHGIIDEVLVRGTKKLKSFPAAAGIMPEAVQNILVLDYGTDESLAIIKERAGEIAAILVEPVQSRRPEFTPIEFLKEIREITRTSGSALIFDEVITGFRMHPGGAQALFGIKADLASYGKVVGGGIPIGVIAGKKEFMNALDGGEWQYGDNSFPEAGVTYFAGTFVRHPLALVSAKASLIYMKEKGQMLQQELNKKGDYIASTLNGEIEKRGLPFFVANFGSLWRVKFHVEVPYSELMFTLMREKGIHILDSFPCFITEATSDSDIDQIIKCFVESMDEMISAGFFSSIIKQAYNPSSIVINADHPPVFGAKLGKDKMGNPAWFIKDPEREGNYLQVEIN